MEDASAITKDERIPEILKVSETSILREAKPQADISINKTSPTEISPDLNPSCELPKSKDDQKTPSDLKKEATLDQESPKAKSSDGSAKIETVFEKLNISSEKTDSTTDSAVSAKDKDGLEVKEAENETNGDLLKGEHKSQPKIAVPPFNFEIKGRSSEPNGDISSMGTMEVRRSTGNLYSVKGALSGRINRQRDSTSNVFPVGCMGCKEEVPLESKASPRRFLDAREASKDFVGHLDKTPRKRPSSGRTDIQRNPLTGAGVETVEARRQLIKRKDGNPLLGTGYEEPPAVVPSSSRIPPGGHSQGLW